MTGPITGAAWGVEALIGSALLMGLVLLARRPVRRAFGPDIAYALWALPALRLVLPPLPAGWARTAVTPVARASEQVGVLLTMPAQPVVVAAPVAAPLFDLALIAPALLAVWAAGALAFLVWHALAHRRFCHRLLAGMTDDRSVDGIRVIETRAASGPLAFGIWRRTVALPSDLADRFDADECDLALAHELGHHARGDLLANWVALLVLALHWFNPLAWRAFRAFRADQEMANDAHVLAGLSPMRRHAYACALVKAASPVRLGGAVSAACHLHTIDDLKGRLKMLTTTRVSRARLTAGVGALSLLIVGGLGVTASGTAAARVRTSVETATGVDLGSAAQTAPSPEALPEPPAPPAPTENRALPPVPRSNPNAVVEASPHKIRKVVIVKDGKTTTYDQADIDAHLAAHDRVSILPLDPHGSRMIVKDPNDPDSLIEVQDIPAVSAANCGIGTGTPMSMVIKSGKGPKRQVVICTDRIERVATHAALVAANGKDIERNAYRSALAGLRKAREKAADETGPRSGYSIPAIDAAIAEVEKDLADLN